MHASNRATAFQCGTVVVTLRATAELTCRGADCNDQPRCTVYGKGRSVAHTDGPAAAVCAEAHRASGAGVTVPAIRQMVCQFSMQLLL